MTTTIFVLSVVAGVLATELTDFFPAIARRVVRWHVGRLPEGLRERALEEWSADLDDIPGRVFKLLYALDLFRAVNGMVWDAERRGKEPQARIPETIYVTDERFVVTDEQGTVAALEDFLRVVSDIAHHSPDDRETLRLTLKDFMLRSPHEFLQVMRRLASAAQARHLQLMAQEASGEKRE